MRKPAPRRDVVLVGGGHAHVQVLRRWAMDPPEDVRLTVVLDRPVAVYSGMVPGFVAGDYRMHELEIDVVPLARRAGAGVVLSAALDIDPVAHEIDVEGRPPLRFDLASLDVGSTVRGLGLAGVREHALSTRPIGHFVRAVDARVEDLRAIGRTPRVVVVGGGAAGSEIALTLHARLRSYGLAPEMQIVTDSDGLLPGAPARVRRALANEAERVGIEVLLHRRVERLEAGEVWLEPPGDSVAERDVVQKLEADLVVWATGAAPVAFPAHERRTSLPRDEHGFLEVRDTLQAVGFDDVFAVGDCARLVDHRWVPRAGVYAVRQGPVLEGNLRLRLAGRAPKPYEPQRDFLSLLHAGEGRAIGAKWGLAFAGGPVLRLKDWIDRRFMSRFQVLDEQGAPRPELAELGAMGGDDEEEMACGGCAAKLGALPLSAALAKLPKPPADPSVLLGLDARDDVAATRDESGRTTLHNVDVIRAFCDDPWLVGRVAASNATSDLYAKGGRPRHAQAVIGLPDLPAREAEEILFQVLSGVRETLDAEGVTLLGGHTTLGDDLTVGLSVTGDGPGDGALLRQAGAKAGDALLLTKPLGTGVVLAADMQGLARGPWVEAVYASMLRTNARAAAIAQRLGAHAATDVTGFGFAGHLLTMLEPAGLSARIDPDAIPLLSGARHLWGRGLRSTAHPANEVAFGRRAANRSDDALAELDAAWLFDPQTAGGLLVCVSPGDAAGIAAALESAGEPAAARVGELCAAPTDGAPRIELHPAS